MRTPISYYGGKQTMLKHILPLIPSHKIYTEAFCGGAAVLFAKRPAEAEIINDINMELTNFYWCAQVYYSDLKHEIDKTLHSRDLHARRAHQLLSAVLHSRRAGVGCMGALQDVVRLDDGRDVRIRLQRHDDQEAAQREG